MNNPSEPADAITADRLREVVSYDAATGIFRWLRSTRVTRAGGVAGRSRTDGYIRIGIDGQRYLAHRLAWLYVRGEWPAHGLDHRDLCASNNAFANLRPATQSQNLCNRRMPACNTSGAKGVCWDKRRAKWIVSVKVKRKNHFVGRYDDLIAATLARSAAAALLHGQFFRGD